VWEMSLLMLCSTPLQSFVFGKLWKLLPLGMGGCHLIFYKFLSFE